MKTTVTRKNSHLNELNARWNVVFLILLTIVMFTVILPVVLIFIISFTSEASIAKVGYSFFPLEWTLDGYRYLLRMGDQLWRSYFITIFSSVVGTILSVFVMAMYAYVIAVRDFPYRRFLTWFLFITLLFSGGLVPSYILNVRYLHINNTVWILLLPEIMQASKVIILRTFIKTTIPDALYDSAKIDGAGHFTIFLRIVIPLSKAGIATIALFVFIDRWNDWFTAMLYNEDKNLIPIQTLLTNLQNSVDYLKKNSKIMSTMDGIEMLKRLPSSSLRMACTIAATLPMMAAYPFFQRYFVQGLTVGSIKE
ncbi:MAG: carbohydrate ABC transporter permease [Lachnospiraceae bacterium]|nr:carbohydrate ABC transporter permease [Lachnospiraceae bacterium]